MKTLIRLAVFVLTLVSTLYAADRSVVKAYKTNAQPTIDGSVDEEEWAAAGPWIAVTADSPNAQIGNESDEIDPYSGAPDLSYRFKVMWEEETFKFFVLYEVFDDIAATQEPREDRIWERDQVETFLDGTNLEGDDDPASYHWWNSDETYGKLGVNRDNLFEGNTGKMTDDQELWNDYNPQSPLIGVAASGPTGEAANYFVELGVTLEPMWDDFNFFPFENTPADDAGHIVEDSTTVKFTNAVSDDDDFDLDGTDRSSTLVYYRERDGEVGQWDQSSYFADLAFVGEFVGVPGDCDGDGELTAADLSCQTADTIGESLEALGILAGDLDGDGEVAFADFLTLSSNFGQEVADYSLGDVDLNGVIEFADFLTLSANFGKTLVAANAVPEPSTELLAGLALVVMTVSVRRGRKSS